MTLFGDIMSLKPKKMTSTILIVLSAIGLAWMFGASALAFFTVGDFTYMEYVKRATIAIPYYIAFVVVFATGLHLFLKYIHDPITEI
jgi:hypothetical protein